jgi:uncharacterized cupin superfamily protein
MTNLASSAPHIHDAAAFADRADRGPLPDAIVPGSHATGRLLWKGRRGQPESGLRVYTPGTWRLSIPRDAFCHLTAGRATDPRNGGEGIAVTPGTCVLFPPGWTGTCTVHDTIRTLSMLA